MENQDNSASPDNSESPDYPEYPIDIALETCGQTEILQFEDRYPNSVIKTVKKIGEGTYGQGYLLSLRTGATEVLKIQVLGQYENLDDNTIMSVLPEVKISKEVSKLQAGFCKTRNVYCLKGPLPEKIRIAGGKSHETQTKMVYLVSEMENGGKELRTFEFENASITFSVIEQVAISLAIAEKRYQFEHRDLHFANILLKPVHREKIIHYKLNSKTKKALKSRGVEVTIIDFSCSRMTVDGAIYYCGLACGPGAFNDPAHETYNLMHEVTGDDWSRFEPRTNILWLKDILDKMINRVQYTNKETPTHQEYMTKLCQLKELITNCPSANSFAEKYLL